MNESLAFHLLNRIPGCGAKTLRLAVSHFGSAQAAWEAPATAWSPVGEQTRFPYTTLEVARQSLDPTEEACALVTAGIEVIPFTSESFPKLLHETPAPPALLYARGGFRGWNTRPCIAVVGSRKCTGYGRQATEELSRALSAAGCLVVSGLAFGIDSIAHEAALEEGGTTVAVLGSGIDDRSLSPQSRLALGQRITESGALLSEYAPGTPPTTGTFPARNRIIAGMTQGTLVVEAAEDSGSLITARLALDYNRSVFAVPGSIFSSASSGTHALIKEGAALVTGISDILETLGVSGNAGIPEVEETVSPEEARVLALLSREPLHVDKLIALARLDTTQVSRVLTTLELRGLVKNIGNMHYIRVR
jgi:DNA processing protein